MKKHVPLWLLRLALEHSAAPNRRWQDSLHCCSMQMMHFCALLNLRVFWAYAPDKSLNYHHVQYWADHWCYCSSNNVHNICNSIQTLMYYNKSMETEARTCCPWTYEHQSTHCLRFQAFLTQCQARNEIRNTNFWLLRTNDASNLLNFSGHAVARYFFFDIYCQTTFTLNLTLIQTTSNLNWPSINPNFEIQVQTQTHQPDSGVH